MQELETRHQVLVREAENNAREQAARIVSELATRRVQEASGLSEQAIQEQAGAL